MLNYPVLNSVVVIFIFKDFTVIFCSLEFNGLTWWQVFRMPLQLCKRVKCLKDITCAGAFLLLDKTLLSGATFISLPPEVSFSATVASLIVVITARLDAIHGAVPVCKTWKPNNEAESRVSKSIPNWFPSEGYLIVLGFHRARNSLSAPALLTCKTQRRQKDAHVTC